MSDVNNLTADSPDAPVDADELAVETLGLERV